MKKILSVILACAMLCGMSTVAYANEGTELISSDMDLDALGSALGLYYFSKECGKQTKIIYDEKFVESKTRKAFKQMVIMKW